MPDHDHNHAHDHAAELRGASWRSLWIAFGLTSAYMLVELVGGLLADSLALLADAAHMLTDAASLALSIFAMWLAKRAVSSRLTFGYYRAEILAALADAIALWAMAGWIFFEASSRFREPPEVVGPLMLTVGFVGLIVNIAAALVLAKSAGHNLNVEGAFLHVLGDLAGSVGVLVASGLIILFDWNIADPLFAVLIGVLILVSAGRLGWKVGRVLMQGTPADLDLGQLCHNLEAVPGVTGIHDIHAWTLTSDYHVLSAHVTTGRVPADRRQVVLQGLRRAAADTPGVSHMTFQVEEDGTGCEEEMHHASHD
jgi:cobalt-zinc-cadmium efflux system protein